MAARQEAGLLKKVSLRWPAKQLQSVREFFRPNIQENDCTARHIQKIIFEPRNNNSESILG